MKKAMQKKIREVQKRCRRKIKILKEIINKDAAENEKNVKGKLRETEKRNTKTWTGKYESMKNEGNQH